MKRREKTKIKEFYIEGIYPTKPVPFFMDTEKQDSDFLLNIWKIKYKRLIVTLLMQETSENNGVTAYWIGKYLGISPGNVRKVLLELKNHGFVRIRETEYKKKKRYEYFMDDFIKKYINILNPFLGVDYEEEAEFILSCIIKRGLINPKLKVTERNMKEYFKQYPLPEYIGDKASQIAKSLGIISMDTFLIWDVDEKMYEKDGFLIPYGVAFNALREAIIKNYLTFIFGEKDRIKKLEIYPYLRLYQFYTYDEFIEDAQALYEHSEDVIDRMFFRKPEFFPDSKNGGNKS